MIKENCSNFYNALPVGVLVLDQNCSIVDINKWFEKRCKIEKENILGEFIGSVFSYFDRIDITRKFKILKHIQLEIEYEDDSYNNFYFPLYDKEGYKVFQKINIASFRQDHELFFIITVNDITKESELESKLNNEKNKTLELDTSLSVVLNKFREEKNNFCPENVKFNIHEVFLPMLKQVKNTVFNIKQKNYLSLLENSLESIFRGDQKELAQKFGLTSTELQILEFIKNGHQTKEISEILHVSHKTIEVHRSNIRKKLKINDQKISIFEYLKNQ